MNLSDNVKILRIVDANINRSREALRVIEEITRFILENKTLTTKVKKCRHLLDSTIRGMKLDMRDIELSRESARDVGKELNIASEMKKRDIGDILMANIHRAEESLRVLEEFMKLFDIKASAGFKKLRFEVYTFERDVVENFK